MHSSPQLALTAHDSTVTSTTSVEPTELKFQCKLCRQHGWLRGRVRPSTSSGQRVQILCKVLVASAEQGCDTCNLLFRVFEPYSSDNGNLIDVQFNPASMYPSNFYIWVGPDHQELALDTTVQAQGRLPGMGGGTGAHCYLGSPLVV
jgi:hypothetical protein